MIVERSQRRRSLGSGGNDDELDLPPFSCRTQKNGILQRRGIVCGVFFRALDRGGRTDQRLKLSRLFSKTEGAQSRIPLLTSSGNSSGPLQLEITIENSLDFQRLGSIDFQSNHGARFMHRHEQSLANGKNVAAVDDGGRFGMNNQSSGKGFRGQRGPINVEPQMKITQDL